MQYLDRINGIERRAERIHLPLRTLCSLAGLNVSTFYRWRQENANPRLRSMLTALDAMETELDRREGELVEQLTRGAA